MLIRNAISRRASCSVVFVLSMSVPQSWADDLGPQPGSRAEKAPKPMFEISAYGVLGVEHWDEFYDRRGEDEDTVPMVRRLKAEFAYRPSERWYAELGIDYGIVWGEEGRDQELEIKDAFVRYSWPGKLRLQVGHMVEPFGFERMTGYSKLGTAERSQVTSAFAPGRSYGLMFGTERKRMTWAIGLFQESQSEDSAKAVTGRVTYAPVKDESNLLHLGLSASVRDLNNERYQIRERAEVFSGATISRSPRFDADEAKLVGTELVWRSGSFSLMNELMAQHTEQTEGADWTYAGYYTQFSYFLTGEQRPYKNGGFGQVQPLSSSGAWELVGRFSQLDLRDNGLGSETSVGLIGVNYYLGSQLILKLNYLRSDISGNTLHDETEGNAVVLRVQASLF